ncbi:MAG: hypothetical protein HOU81_19205 [Hamadaea sp.]|uniref:hypothetical protein n=1 Tax=Hamadaea sp. TaxID=2024425 RepID=UPI0017AF99DD|nr:hypothetical protein [Hamadaea sp.]NUR72949.1 hypothetical protein [Hamadaea sp.]NUT21752.1 hypothetical protein [Hamadaea sp.]
MRHVWSLLAGLIVAPLIFAASSVIVEMTGDWTMLQTVFLVPPALLIGALAVPRISPVGPIAAGLLLVTPRLLVTVFDVSSDRLFRPPLSSVSRIAEGVLFRPESGLISFTAFVGGVILLLTAASPSRWRGRPKTPTAASPVEPVVDTGRIDAVAAWRPFPADSSETAAPVPSPAPPENQNPGSPPTGPWAGPPSR